MPLYNVPSMSSCQWCRSLPRLNSSIASPSGWNSMYGFGLASIPSTLNLPSAAMAVARQQSQWARYRRMDLPALQLPDPWPTNKNDGGAGWGCWTLMYKSKELETSFEFKMDQASNLRDCQRWCSWTSYRHKKQHRVVLEICRGGRIEMRTWANWRRSDYCYLGESMSCDNS